MPSSVQWYGPELIAKARAGAFVGVVQGIGLVEQHTIDLILNTQKTGRIYRRRGTLHQASAPGEPPASDTGHLVNARRIETNERELSAKLVWASLHAWFLEHGTRNMAPRPFARRGLDEVRDQVEAGIANGVAAALT